MTVKTKITLIDICIPVSVVIICFCMGYFGSKHPYITFPSCFIFGGAMSMLRIKLEKKLKNKQISKKEICNNHH